MTCHQACAPVVLFDGTKSCNYSEAWRHECEARWLLNLPMNKQNEMAAMIARKRGSESLARLEITLGLLRQARAKSPSSFLSARSTRPTPASTGARGPVAPSTSAGLHGQLF